MSYYVRANPFSGTVVVFVCVQFAGRGGSHAGLLFYFPAMGVGKVIARVRIRLFSYCGSAPHCMQLHVFRFAP